MKSMTTRERFKAITKFEKVDRLPIVEWACWWNKTIERWHSEGLPQDITDRYDICRYFKQDAYRQEWYRSISPDTPKPTHHGAGLIQTPEDYKALKKHLFQINDEWPINLKTLEEVAKEQEKGDCVFWITLDGFFWFPRMLFGIENHLYAFYDYPELMKEINEKQAEWMIRIIDKVCSVCTPDFMTFAEDMSYNNGPMLSEDLFDEFMLPYYNKVVPYLEEKGIFPVIDSDGDVTIAAGWFEKAGLKGILPIERQAGTDIAELRKKHPEMVFIGCFDKMTMTQGEEAMRKEFERLIPVAKDGGLIISCDHQTPPGVSLENYKLYLKLFREYAVC